MADRAHAVYRLLNAEGVLLYVGVSVNPEARFIVHERDKAWWPEVFDRRIEWHSDRRTALATERAAIRSEQPLHNAVHLGRARTPTSSVHPLGSQRNIRVPSHVWTEAARRARQQGKRDGVSQLLREFTAWYVDKPGAKLPRPSSKRG